MEQTLLQQQVQQWIEQLGPQAYALNQDLALHPELSGEEVHACGAICGLMREHGIPVEEHFCGIPTAFRAAVRQDPHSPVRVCLLAEYDALPTVGHGCGHSASGAMSVLAALALSKLEGLAGNIDLIGTPDEERYGRKITMAEAGVFDGYDLAIMVHCENVTRARICLQGLEAYRFSFTGQTAHASADPWNGRNALNGVMLFFHAIDCLRQHIRPQARIHGFVSQGGEAANIVPDFAAAEVLVRYPEKTYLKELRRLVEDCARGAAIATQTEMKMETTGPAYDSMKENLPGIERLEAIFDQLGLSWLGASEEPMGASDIGNVSFCCPALQPLLQVTEQPVPWHSREVSELMATPEKINPKIAQGAAILALMSLAVLTEPELRNRIREAFLQ